MSQVDSKRNISNPSDYFAGQTEQSELCPQLT